MGHFPIWFRRREWWRLAIRFEPVPERKAASNAILPEVLKMATAIDYHLYSDAFQPEPAPEDAAASEAFSTEGFAIPETMRDLIRTEADRWRESQKANRRGLLSRLFHHR